MRLPNIALGLVLAACVSSALAQPASPPRPDQAGMQDDRDAEDAPEPPPTPEQQAKLAAAARYQHAMEASLRASASPRDWALSTQVMHVDELDGTDATDAARGMLLRKAAEAAPNDRLVQWIWAVAPAEMSGCTAASPCRDRGSALTRLEPNNGAAWVPAVADAVRFDDAPSIDAALAHMAAATRYDEAFHDAISAWIDLFQRFQLSPELLRMPDGKAGDATLAADTDAFAQQAATLPPYDELIHACRRDPQSQAASARSESCAKAGRLMVDRSTTIVGRIMGDNLLRVSGAASTEDHERSRTAAWQLEQHMRLMQADGNDLARMRQQMDLIVASDSEVAAMQEELRRANVPLTPPAEWQLTRQNGPAGPPRDEPQPDVEDTPDHRQ